MSERLRTMFARWFHVLLLMACCVGAAAQMQPEAPPPTAIDPDGPRLAIMGEKEAEFGVIVQGEVVRRSFKLRNAGKQELELLEVSVSCNCSSWKASTRKLAPGAEADLEVTFDSAERQGYQSIVVQISSNDPTAQDQGQVGITRLNWRGEVKSLFAVMPGTLYFPECLRGQTVMRKLKITPGSEVEGTPRITGAVSPSPYLTVTLEQVGRDHFVLAELRPEAPIGVIEGLLVLQTDHPRQKFIRVPVYGTVLGRVMGYPEQAFYGAQDRRQAFKQKLTVALRLGADLKILALRPTSECPFSARLIALVPGTRYEIALEIKPDAPPGLFAERVEVYTNDAEQPRLAFAVLGEILPDCIVEPQALVLSKDRSQVNLTVKRRSGSSFALKAARLEGQGVTVGAITSVGEGVWTVAVSRPGQERAEGWVVLETDHPGEPQVRVAVHQDE